MKHIGCAFIVILVLSFGHRARCQETTVDFESDRWTNANAEIVDHLDRRSLIGTALLEDVEFDDGIIEVDIAVDGGRSYPGIIFRYQSPGNYEKFYIRPHRAPLYPDALQYMPVINGIGCWQLYNGDGYTAMGEIPAGQWIHVRMEVKGEQARVFVDDMESPALVVDNLQHGMSKGSIGVEGPRNRTAYFSNFRYTIDDGLVFDPAPKRELPPGMLAEWDLSQTFKINDVTPDRYPNVETLNTIEWQEIRCEPSGLVNVARYITRVGREPDCVFARTTIKSDEAGTKKLLFGYSDDVTVFLNGEILFAGESAYRQRDPSFLGIIGLFDTVHLPLREGDNELLLMVAESFGGWGFMCRDGEAVFRDESVRTSWESENELLYPESAVYDHARKVIYVSNFDPYNKSAADGGQFISKLSLDGEIIERKWVAALRGPTGMVIWEDKLFVVERARLAEIAIETREVLARYAFPQPRLPNDVAVDDAGRLYVSDSRKHVIYRLIDGEFEEWLSGAGIGSPNGLLIHDGRLIVGNNADHSVKAVDLSSKKIVLIARLEPGIIDGIKVDDDGNYIVSHAEGRIYRITVSGEVSKLIDTTGPGQYTADFEYIADKKLLVVPTLLNDRVIAYRLE